MNKEPHMALRELRPGAISLSLASRQEPGSESKKTLEAEKMCF